MTLMLTDVLRNAIKLKQLDITKWDKKQPPELERESKLMTLGVFKSAKSSFKEEVVSNEFSNGFRKSIRAERFKKEQGKLKPTSSYSFSS